MSNSLPQIEIVFSRTMLALLESEKAKLLREFAQSADARIFQRFPAFLTRRKWPPGRDFVPDLARLELLLWMAASAPEIECMGFENVAVATEPEWYAARFRFDPAHRLMDSDWPLEAVFADPHEEHSSARGTYLVFRSQGAVQFRRLKANEALLISSLQLGVPLGRVLERNGGPDFDAMTFHQWIESGLLRSIDWTGV